jgi:hypothetical protein
MTILNYFLIALIICLAILFIFISKEGYFNNNFIKNKNIKNKISFEKTDRIVFTNNSDKMKKYLLMILQRSRDLICNDLSKLNININININIISLIVIAIIIYRFVLGFTVGIGV